MSKDKCLYIFGEWDGLQNRIIFDIVLLLSPATASPTGMKSTAAIFSAITAFGLAACTSARHLGLNKVGNVDGLTAHAIVKRQPPPGRLLYVVVNTSDIPSPFPLDFQLLTPQNGLWQNERREMFGLLSNQLNQLHIFTPRPQMEDPVEAPLSQLGFRARATSLRLELRPVVIAGFADFPARIIREADQRLLHDRFEEEIRQAVGTGVYWGQFVLMLPDETTFLLLTWGVGIWRNGKTPVASSPSGSDNSSPGGAAGAGSDGPRAVEAIDPSNKRVPGLANSLGDPSTLCQRNKCGAWNVYLGGIS